MFKFVCLPLLGSLAVMLSPAAARAHARLVASSPAGNASVTRASQIVLRFSERLNPATVRAELVMTGMPGMADHPPMKIAATTSLGSDGKTAIVAPRRTLVRGTYKLTWSMIGADTHPVTGQLSFTVK